MDFCLKVVAYCLYAFFSFFFLKSCQCRHSYDPRVLGLAGDLALFLLVGLGVVLLFGDFFIFLYCFEP